MSRENGNLHQDMVQLSLPASRKYLNVLSSSLAAMLERAIEKSEEQIVYNMQLAVQEVCTNIVDHAYADTSGGRIDITLTFEQNSRRFVIDLQDTGSAFNKIEISPPGQDEVRFHGYGLFLVHELMDEVNYHIQSNRNHWRLVKNI